MIKLTNATPEHAGNPLYINPEWISSVFEAAKQPGGSLTTFVFGGPIGNVWEVEESPSKVVQLIETWKKMQ